DLDHLVDVSGRSVVAGEDAEALPHGEVRVERRRLQHHADALAPGRPGALGICSQHLDVAGVALSVALADLDGRRLARPVRADPLAGGDGEVETGERLVVSVALAKACDGDRGQSSTSTTAPGAKEVSRPASSSTISLQSG